MNKPDLLLTTNQLRILPFNKGHLNTDYISWLNDPVLMKFSEQRHKKHSIESCYTYIKSFDNTVNYFLALENHKGALLGTMTLYQDLNNQLVDMGIMIGSTELRGKGLGQEAWTALSEWVINKLKPRKLTAGCMISNIAMIHIMERSGMQPDGTRKKHYILDGHEEDIIYMAKFLT